MKIKITLGSNEYYKSKYLLNDANNVVCAFTKRITQDQGMSEEILNVAFDILTASEDCKDGMFGPDCSMSCPKNCHDVHCDPITGECYGCLSGFDYTKNKTCTIGKKYLHLLLVKFVKNISIYSTLFY